MEHPHFSVTNDKGRFTIRNLPAGKYTLAAWHEELGEREMKITVGADSAPKVTFTFKSKN